MDVLEGYGRGAEVMELYAVRAAFGLKPSKSCFKFAMQACASDRNVDGALLVLRDAQACSLDSPSMYNMTVILADAKGRNEEAITVLLQPASSPEEAPVFPPKPSNMPPVWVTREIISNALIALTRNFSASFTDYGDRGWAACGQRRCAALRIGPHRSPTVHRAGPKTVPFLRILPHGQQALAGPGRPRDPAGGC